MGQNIKQKVSSNRKMEDSLYFLCCFVLYVPAMLTVSGILTAHTAANTRSNSLRFRFILECT